MTDDSPPDGGLDGFARLRRRALIVYGLIALALAGFDIGLLAAFAATAVAVLRCSPLLPLFASMTGTLLLSDAWFDLLTSRPGSERLWASVEALLGELPLAVFSFWVAYDAEKVHASTRRYVAARRLRREAGATVD